MKYQNYAHYKLPITMNPLEYGDLIEQIGNKYIIQLTTTNILIIQEYENANFIRFFRKGELMFEFKDHKIDDSTFTRVINDSKFTFVNQILVKSEILWNNKSVIIYENKNSILYYTDSKSIDPVLKTNTPSSLIKANSTRSFSTSAVNHAKHPGNIVKLRRKSRNVWDIIKFDINNKIFTADLFLNRFEKFWSQIENKFTNDNHMYILFKVKYVGSEYKTIRELQRINKVDKNWYISWILTNMINQTDFYNETGIESFVFSYGFKNEAISNKKDIRENINMQKLENKNLPISINPLDYGLLIDTNKYDKYIKYTLSAKGDIFIIKKFESHNEIELFKNDILLIKYTDTNLFENKFIRSVNNKKYYFENNIQILATKEIKTKFISKLQKSKVLTENFLTLDIETFVKDSILIVFCISIYDGVKTQTFILNDFKNPEELILTALKSIMIRKYNKWNVYIHNMAKFDMIFLLKYLVKLGSVQPIIHGGRLISVTLNFGKNNEYQLKFKDSYLILLASLFRLCKAFKVENSKSIFPIFFVNKDNLNYIGEVPEMKFFPKINISEYKEYKNKHGNNWNLRNEVIKYCELDCISLHQILFKFSHQIFDLFERNIHNYSTLPSLAFAIFRGKFMEKENIPQLSGKIAKDIRQGYTGGAVDMYIPESGDEPVFCYDVNSLYPSVMQKEALPLENPTYFEGDIRKIDKNAFGFFYCRIKTPDNILHPIIQTHVKIKGVTSTISPLGYWEDMIFSAEMDNAQKYGYKFEILWGYTFKKANIFKDYVDFLYALRLNYSKDDPLNFIAKILLNSLYGRFGMDDNFWQVDIILKELAGDFENKYLNDIIDDIELDDYILYIRKSNENIENDDSTHNVSVGVASAITAYSRIHISQFKNNPDFILYYTDTDSIYIDRALPDHMISSKILGKLKLENVCEKAIFLAPKLYFLKTIEGEIITKTKGLKHEIELTQNDFKKLLVKNTKIIKYQPKWFRKLSEAKISILEQPYTLILNDNKRKLIFDKNSKLIKTKPYKINNSKIINN